VGGVEMVGFGIWRGLEDSFQASWGRSGFSFWVLGGCHGWCWHGRLDLGVVSDGGGLGL